MILQIRQFLTDPIAEFPDLEPQISDIEVVFLHELFVLCVEIDFWLDELFHGRVDLHGGMEKLPETECVVS